MRKILLLFCLLAIFIPCSTVLAESSYIECDIKQDYTYYVDTKTVSVEEYNPPKYQIAVDIVLMENSDKGNTAITDRFTRRYRYNWDKKQMFMLSNKGWVYLNPRGSRAAGADKIKAGEIAFQIAYNMHFGAK